MRKKYFIRTLLAGLLLGILVAGSAGSSTLLDEAEKLSWDTQNIGVLKALFPNRTSVETFLKEVDPVLEAAEARVGEYEITNLGNDGKLELLATIDVSGRGFTNSLLVVQKVNNTLEISKLSAPGIGIYNLKSCIVDLNNDGVREVLLPRALAVPKFGTDPRSFINDVYEWDKAGFHKANASFKNYYRSLLPGLKAEHEAIVQGKKSWSTPHRRTCSEKSMRGKSKRLIKY